MRVCVLTDTSTDKAVKGGHVCVCVRACTDRHLDRQGYEKEGMGR